MLTAETSGTFAATSDMSDPEGVGKPFSATGVAGAGEICGKNAGAKRLGPAQSGIKLAICRAFEGRSRRHDGAAGGTGRPVRNLTGVGVTGLGGRWAQTQGEAGGQVAGPVEGGAVSDDQWRNKGSDRARTHVPPAPAHPPWASGSRTQLGLLSRMEHAAVGKTQPFIIRTFRMTRMALVSRRLDGTSDSARPPRLAGCSGVGPGPTAWAGTPSLRRPRHRPWRHGPKRRSA